MTYFTGQDTAELEETLRAILTNFLAARLPVTSAEIGNRVRFVKDESEANKRLKEESLVAVVYITFSDGAHETSEWPTTIRGPYEKGERHEIECRLHIITDAKCASLEGPLRDAIRYIVNKNSNRRLLRMSGLFNARVIVDKSLDDENRAITPYSFLATVYTFENGV